MTIERLIEEKPKIFETKESINRWTEYLGPRESVEKQLRSLYLINTRLWLDDLSKKNGRVITIGNVPENEWEKLFEKYDNFWFMGIYKPSQKGQEIAKNYSCRYGEYLPDLDQDKDVVASPFAVVEHSPNPTIAKDWQEWDQMVEKLHQRGKKVFIDFVPNHTAIDHPWVETHPEYYVLGNENLFRTTDNFISLTDSQGQTRYFSYGKDPNFEPWIDTLQLNYANIELQEKMRDQLIALAKHADGFRCDMAMLVNPETFLRSWNWCLNLSSEEIKEIRENPFWAKTIPEIKNRILEEDNRNVEFIAEAYWEEGDLGKYFDFIYHHNFYQNVSLGLTNGWTDKLKEDYFSILENFDQTKNQWLVYIENHDEQRVIDKMGENFSKTAAVLCALVNKSMFMVNQGQEFGCQFRPPMQVSRYRKEVVNLDTVRFYDDLLSIRRSELFQTGEIRIIESKNYDQNSILLEVTKKGFDKKAVVAINMSHQTTLTEIGSNENPLFLYSLTRGQISNDYEVDLDKLTINLIAGEVKIIILPNKSTQTRQNLVF